MAKSKAEYSKEAYWRKKEQGLCVHCGKPRDRETSCLCNACTEKIGKNVMLDYKAYRDVGLCPRCRTNNIMGDEKSCPECRAKMMVTNARYEKLHREEINARKRIEHKERRKKRAEQGLCTYCGKPLDEIGYKKCSRCRAKRRIKQQEERARNYTKPKTVIWKENGWCTRCGSPEVKKGYKVCEECYKYINDNVVNCEKSKRARQEWKDRETIIIKRRRMANG